MYYTIGYLQKAQNDGNTAADAMRAAVDMRYARNQSDAPRNESHAARRVIGAGALGATSKEALSAPMCAYLLRLNDIARISHLLAPLLLGQFLAHANDEPIDIVIDSNNESDRIVAASQVTNKQTNKQKSSETSIIDDRITNENRSAITYCARPSLNASVCTTLLPTTKR